MILRKTVRALLVINALQFFAVILLAAVLADGLFRGGRSDRGAAGQQSAYAVRVICIQQKPGKKLSGKYGESGGAEPEAAGTAS